MLDAFVRKTRVYDIRGGQERGIEIRLGSSGSCARIGLHDAKSWDLQGNGMGRRYAG